jgi:hypothetical protein
MIGPAPAPIPHTIWALWHERGKPGAICDLGPVTGLSQEEAAARPFPTSPDGTLAGRSTTCPHGEQAEWLHTDVTDGDGVKYSSYFANSLALLQRTSPGWAADVEPWPFPAPAEASDAG